MSLALITAGMAIGFAYVVWPWFRTTLAPIADLLIAGRPLLIPLLVAIAAATINLPLWVQVITAIVLVLFVHRVIIRPELERSSEELGQWWHAIENGALNAIKKMAWLAGPALALAWIGFSVLFTNGFLAGQGGLPAAALLVALVALVAALFVRLAGYATTWSRGIVSLLVGLAALSGLMAAGLTPGYDSAAAGALWLAAAAAAALVITILLERLRRPIVRSTAGIYRSERFLGLGLTLAMISGVLLVFASASSLWLLNHPDVTFLRADRGAHATLYRNDDDSIAYRHAPVLAFTQGQRWTPINVDTYVQRARIVRKDGSEATVGHYHCSSLGPSSCLRITIDCPNATARCAHAQLPHPSGAHVSSGAVYVRTLRRPDDGDTSDKAVALRGLFRPATDVAQQTQVLLQYWFFYPYDEWTTKVLGARLTQRHEGDWEAVTVGLAVKDKPLFVAYSAHCGGTWEHWGDTERFGTHPLVAVADGSQANYAEAGAQRPPDFTSCKRLPRGIGTLLAFAANVRDVTSDDWQWGAAAVVPVTERTWPMNFPGTWGGNDVTEFTNARTFTSRPGGGPPSPPLQPLWDDPMKTIFCDRYWDGPEPCQKP
jgi:hypothetical protein